MSALFQLPARFSRKNQKQSLTHKDPVEPETTSVLFGNSGER
jgi:hypothetical protein